MGWRGGDLECGYVSDVGDSMIEVVGLENIMQVGQVIAGLRGSGKRLAQCSQVVIRSVLRHAASLWTGSFGSIGFQCFFLQYWSFFWAVHIGFE